MKFHDEESVNKGILLEQLYKKRLMDSLQGIAVPGLTNRIIGVGNNELGGLEKRPVYEELNKIPLNDQLRMMKQHFDSLPKEEEIDPYLKDKIEKIRKLDIIKGQTVG
jgi:hypothetical protein